MKIFRFSTALPPYSCPQPEVAAECSLLGASGLNQPGPDLCACLSFRLRAEADREASDISSFLDVCRHLCEVSWIVVSTVERHCA